MEYRLPTEEEKKIYQDCNIPVIAGTYSGPLCIVGGSRSMWEDWAKMQEVFPGIPVMCVNIAGLFIPHPVTHLFSWHCKQISHIKGWRKAEYPDDKSMVHSVREFDRIDVVWRLTGGTSVSGLSAIEVAYLMGYRKIVLVGISIDNSGYFYKPYINPDISDQYRRNEVGQVGERVNHCVKSFSGYTREVYGEPTREWING